MTWLPPCAQSVICWLICVLEATLLSICSGPKTLEPTGKSTTLTWP